MPPPLRRLLSALPFVQNGAELYVRTGWHKPTPYDEWRSQPPFRPTNTLRADHFGRSLRRRRAVRGLVRWSLMLGVAWLVIESVQSLSLL
jgi:hypothetical protein